MSPELSQNFCSIILQFLEKVPINANFSEFFKNLFIVHISEHFYKCLSKTVSEFSQFFSKFRLISVQFLLNFPTDFFKCFKMNSNLSCNFSKALNV